MNNKVVNKSTDEQIAYENARTSSDKTPTAVSDKNVEGVNKRINPDINSMESRG